MNVDIDGQEGFAAGQRIRGATLYFVLEALDIALDDDGTPTVAQVISVPFAVRARLGPVVRVPGTANTSVHMLSIGGMKSVRFHDRQSAPILAPPGLALPRFDPIAGYCGGVRALANPARPR